MIVFVDCETLGLDPDLHAVWEVGAIKYDETTDEVKSQRLCQLALTDEQIAAGDPVGMKIGRFDERYRKQGQVLEPAEFCAHFGAFTAGAHLAGAVVSFDEERLRRLMLRHGVTPSWHYHLIDVEALSVGYLAGMAKPSEVVLSTYRSLPWKSDDLSAALGVTIHEDDRHTALGDAQWALDLYRAVTT